MIKAIVFIVVAIFLTLSMRGKETSHESYDPNETKFLEEADGQKAQEWANERTQRTKDYFKSQPAYAPLNQTIKEVLYDKNDLIDGTIHNGYVYNFWMDEKNPQGIWRRTSIAEYAKDSPNWEILIDFDVLSKTMGKKIVFKGFTWYTPHYQRVLVKMSFGGNDEIIFREWDLEKKQFVEGGFQSKNSKGEWIGGKFTKGLWFDENSILCNVVLNPKDLTESLYPNTLYLWKRGTPIEQAQKLFEILPTYIRVGFYPLLSCETHPFLFCIEAFRDFYNADSYIVDEKLSPQKIQMPSDAENVGSFKEYVFYRLQSDWNVGSEYKKGSVVAMHWQDLLKEDKDKTSLQAIYVPQERESFDFLCVTKDTVFLSIFKNINSEIYSFTLKNGKWTERCLVPLPDKIATVGISATDDEEQALMFFQNPLTPPSVYIWGENKEFRQIRKPIHEFDSYNYVAEQRHAISRDGQKVPYFIYYKKGINLDGLNPTLLTGYGGYGRVNYPYYSNFINKVWLNNGGVFVIANIRGGGEFGPDWHTAAVQDKRQTGFDDFVAVAKDLIESKITSPKHLGIKGGSHGGLLVAVSMTQHPELFGAVVCEVPILDMVRFTEFAAGPSWIAEYGDPKDYKMGQYLKGYSPVANVYKNKKYPPLFISSGVNDQRVHPWHARIFEYLMEKRGHKETFFMESKDAGHGGGANLDDCVDYASYIYTFLALNLGLKVQH